MKKIYSFLLGAGLAFNAVSQSHGFCYTSEAMTKFFEANPDKKAVFDQLQKKAFDEDKNAAKHYYSKTSLTPTYTIPVVFHILHLNGPENISDAQVQDAVMILNRDFRKLNPDTANIDPAFKSVATDVNFEFRLATKDPSGNCTNGIVRHYDKRTDWPSNDLAQYVYTWPHTKYLNIYVVRSMTGGAAGYTYLPGTVPAAADVIVLLDPYIGSIGTANPYLSRALTHEVGHWFNLQHTWGMTNNPGVACGDDGVSDTPQTKGFTWCSSTNPSVCNPPVIENIQNYMEYAYCSKMFTAGQVNRMTNCINAPTAGRNNLWSNSNLIATGIINPIGPCAPIADFTSNTNVICVNGSVNFTDLSYNGNVTGWQWSFQGTASSLSVVQNPSVSFTKPGLKSIQLKASNSFGADSITKDLVTVLAGPGSGTINTVQGFETIIFPDTNWITIPPMAGAGWIQSSTVAATGSKCVMVDNYFDSPSSPVTIYSPMFDLSSLTSPALTFKVAHSRNAAGSNDRLKVFYSTDCANSWTTVYSKWGANLHTLGTGSISSAPFTAPSASQWRSETVFLSSLASATGVLLKFEFAPDSINPGNNIFLDDISIESIPGVAELQLENSSISLAPNPSFGRTSLNFVSGSKKTCRAEIMDVTGKLVQRADHGDLEKGPHSVIINTSGLPKGLYILRLSLGEALYSRKLIVE